jgi:predicted permease
MKRGTVKRLFSFTRRSPADVRGDVRDEFQFHLDTRTADLVRDGLTEAEARARALREFGDMTAGTARCAAEDDRVERRRRIGQIGEELRQDVTLGIRLIGRNPWFSTAAILTLAVAIGGNTAIFSILNAVLFKPLPVAASHELARIRGGQSQISWPNFVDVAERAERNGILAGTVAQRRLVAGMANDATPLKLWGEQTTTNYFTVVGVHAAMGRTYTPADTRRDLVVLAHHVWQSRFGSDPSIVGRVLTLNGRSHEVLGVMPRGFRGVAPAGLLQDFWLPLDTTAASALLADRDATLFETFARLAPGVGHEQAESALRVIAGQLRAEHPGIPESFVNMEALPVDGIGGFRGMADLIIPVLAFLTLMALVAGLILLIGCANIAGLLMGRAAARRKEIAMRLALGAGRGRLVRQLLTESLVLAAAGGGAGMLLAIWLTKGVNPFLMRSPVPMEFDLHVDARVLAYLLSVSLVSALVFGLAPARRAARMDLLSSLKDDGHSFVRQRLRRGLVIGQVAVCSVLLIWSGLFLRSLGTIASINPGFDPEGVILARIVLDGTSHDRTFGEALFRDMEQQVKDAAPVESVALATVVPLSLENEAFDVIAESAGAEPRPEIRVMANRLTPGWFDTVRIGFVAGRDFRPDDREGSPLVAIVNDTLAREAWNGQALGKPLRIPGANQVVEIVGVVRDSKYWTLGEKTAPTVYLPFRQSYVGWATLHARTANPRRTSEVITQFAQRRAPDVFVEIGPMRRTVETAMIPARVGAAVTTAFTVVAMLLASLGVYGLVAFSVAQRTRELGVRKAIGATTTDLIRLVVGENIALTLTGLAAGAVVGVLGATVLRTFIAGVSPLDPITLIGTAVLICGATAVASALPAMRAAVVNPLIVLRDS